jgi:type I pantothenate kinase
MGGGRADGVPAAPDDGPTPSVEEEQDYLPLSELIGARGAQLARPKPLVVGIAGSVAVGKSTMARVLAALLARRTPPLLVARVSTDAFLYPNAVLAQRHLLHRKGFPESYDRAALVKFLAAVEAGAIEIAIPSYDHRIYDIVPDTTQVVHRADVLLLEGINVLHPGPPPMAADYLDLAVYLDAETADIRQWFVDRFVALTRAAADDRGSFFAQWVDLAESDLLGLADGVWTHINAVNLTEHILPTRQNADVVVRKAADHRVAEVQILRP